MVCNRKRKQHRQIQFGEPDFLAVAEFQGVPGFLVLVLLMASNIYKSCGLLISWTPKTLQWTPKFFHKGSRGPPNACQNY